MASEIDADAPAGPNVRHIMRLFDGLTDAVLGQGEADAGQVAEIRALSPTREQPYASANRMIYQVMHKIESGRTQMEPLLQAAEGQPPGSPLAEAAAYLAFQVEARQHLRAISVIRPDAESMAGEVDAFLAILDRMEAEQPAVGAHLVSRAKVLSLRDREAAAACLAAAREAAPVFVERLRYDFGTSTYLTREEVAGPGPDYPGEVGRETLRRGLAEQAAAYGTGGLNLVWSCDTRFFRIHGPPWFEVLPHLMRLGVRPVCFMVGEAAEADPLIEEARDLIERTARFRGEAEAERMARAVVFVRLDVPAFVASDMTFYATARHLHARQVIEESGDPAVILDIDMIVREPLAPFLKGVEGFDVGLPHTRGMASMSPWRRYMAGTGWFADTPASLAFLREVEGYIVRGLPREPSWTLDQNALCYAVEASAGAVKRLDLNTGRRPFVQDDLRKQYEHYF